jgi:hypothetical protein
VLARCRPWWPRTAAPCTAARERRDADRRTCRPRSTTQRDHRQAGARRGDDGQAPQQRQAHSELVGALESVQSGVEGLTQSLGKVNKMQLDLAMQGLLPGGARGRHGEFRVDIDPQSGPSTASASSTTPRPASRRRRRR